MKNLSLLCFTMLFIGLSSCNLVQEDPDVKMVTPEEMNDILELEDVQLVDVRTPEEYAEEYIPGSQNIDYNSPTFDEDISKLDKSKPVILYCQKGGRSAKCADKLKEAGFVKIYDLEGGITKWKFKGYETNSSLN